MWQDCAVSARVGKNFEILRCSILLTNVSSETILQLPICFMIHLYFLAFSSRNRSANKCCLSFRFSLQIAIASLYNIEKNNARAFSLVHLLMNHNVQNHSSKAKQWITKMQFASHNLSSSYICYTALCSSFFFINFMLENHLQFLSNHLL